MQGGASGISYGLKYQARCIADVKADTDHTIFIAATLNPKEENEIHLLRLTDSGNEVICDGLFSHPSEIWHLSSCPFNPRIFSTVFSSAGESNGAAVWQIPELYGQLSSPQLEKIAALEGDENKVQCVLWWPSGNYDKVVTVDEQNLCLWSLDSAKRHTQVVLKEQAGMLDYLSGGAWDPHDMNAVATLCESSIHFWDLRSMKKSTTIGDIHVRDMDYDTKRQHLLVTAEDEGGIRTWDLRMPSFPIQEFPGHAHWTWSVRWNPEYEGLILSSGTDSSVNLWNSSTETVNPIPGSPIRSDPLLNSFSDYEDSVYGIVWSFREPWIFASVSYDGRVAVESVKPFLPKK